MTDVPETQKGNWDDDFASTTKKDDKKNENKLEYIKFDQGDTDIRLVGSYVTFLQHWNPPFDKPVRTHKDYEKTDHAWVAGFKPRTQCAIHVIDRRDGKLKVLQKGWSFFSEFKLFKDREGQEPNHHTDSPDFTVTAEWPGGNKRRAKYKVNARRKDTALTDEEKQMVKEQHVDLREQFKPYNLDYINKTFDELPEEDKIPKEDDSDKKDNTQTTASVPAIEESSGSEDGLFPNKDASEAPKETVAADADKSSDQW